MNKLNMKYLMWEFKGVPWGMLVTSHFMSELHCTYWNRDFIRTVQNYLQDYCIKCCFSSLPWCSKSQISVHAMPTKPNPLPVFGIMTRELHPDLSHIMICCLSSCMYPFMYSHIDKNQTFISPSFNRLHRNIIQSPQI